MKNNIRLLSIAAAFLTACSGFTITDANKISKGMSKNQAIDTISVSPEKELLIPISTDPTSKYEVLNFKMSANGTDGIYLLTFKNDSLYYWGYPHEFNRHPSLILNEIGKVAYKKIKDE